MSNESEIRIGLESQENESDSHNLSEDRPVTLDPRQEKKKLRTAFLIALSFGAFMIFVFADSGFVNVLLCSLVMIGYVLYGERVTASLTGKAVFADSVYYVGFLFTFIALTAAMISLDANELDAKKIIGQIGPALITTVIGMAYRIYKTQFEAITQEPEAEVMSGIGELSSNLSSALNQLQVMVQEHALSSGQQQKDNEKIIKSFGDQISQLDFTKPLDALNKLPPTIAALNSELKNLKNRIQSSEDDLQETVKSSFLFREGMDNTLEEFSRYTKLSAHFDKLSNKVNELETSLEDSSKILRLAKDKGVFKKLELLDKDVSSLSARVHGADQTAAILVSSVEAASTQLIDATGKITDSLHGVETMRSSLEDIQALIVELSGLRGSLADHASGLDDISKEIIVEIEAARTKLGDIGELADANVKQLLMPIETRMSALSSSIAPVEQQLGDLNQKVTRSVTDVLEFLNNETSRKK